MITGSKNLAQIDPLILGEYILKTYGAMSHLKLQKLLYYIQAFHLAYFDKPLFKDKFQAWVHGPVIRRLFDELKDKALLYGVVEFKQLNERDPSEVFETTLADDQKDLINEVLKSFSPLSGFELENLTHSERPWIEARQGLGPADKCSFDIDEGVMRDFYRTRINGEVSA